MKQKYSIICVLVIFGIIIISSCVKENLPPENVLTLDNLYKNGITNYVGENIFIKTKIKWEYSSTKIPEDPTPIEEIQKRISVPHPTVVFNNIDQYIQINTYSKPGNFFIVSEKLVKIRDSNNKEQYSYDGNVLSNDERFYILEGKLKYREWLNVTEDKLSNSQFIEQSNNPLYWSQTFEFELKDIT